MREPPSENAEQLDENDLFIIRTAFEEQIIPRLKLYNARIGTMPCDFAGERYGKWLLYFRSQGETFEITGFEYDEDVSSIDL